jgi:lysophospholipase L1-like esterase
MVIKRLWESDLAKALAVILPVAGALGLWKNELLSPDQARLLYDVSNRGLNDVAFDALTKDYYEQVMTADRGQWLRGGVVRFVSRMLRKGETGAAKGNWIRLQDTEAIRYIAEGFLSYEFIPESEVIHMGATVRSNRWGMRDRDDIERTKPPGTFRIALVGGSNTMGYGVELEGTFAKLLEERLNEEVAGTPGAADRYEVLNFSVGGYQLLDRLYVVEQRMPSFQPDMILVSVTMHDLRWAVHQRLADKVKNGRELHFEFVKEVVRDEDLEAGQSEARIRQRLKPRAEELVSGAFRELLRLGREMEAPVIALMLRLRVNEIHPTMHRQAELAEEVGLPVVRIFDAYEGQTAEDMYLRPTDQHPTAEGHRLIADELFEKMLGNPAIRNALVRQDAGEENEAQ